MSHSTPRFDPRRQRTVLLVCGMSLFMTYLDNTILNVALPRIQADLRVGLTGLQWIVDAYLLVLGGLMLLSGSLADRFGRRRLFLTGLALFSGGSLGCAGAPGAGWLIAARALQAVGGVLMTPSSLSIVRHVFTDPAQRARAMGVWSMVFGVATACGPLVGGLLVDSLGWRSVFWVNLPIGALAWLLGRKVLPESRAERPRRLDPAGQLLAVLLLVSITGAVIQGPSRGWTSPLIVGAGATAVLALGAFLLVEWRSPEPMLELRYFRLPSFTAATAIAFWTFIVLAGFLFVTTLYLQQARGMSPFRAGLATLPATAAIALAAYSAGHWDARRGPREPLLVGGCLVAAGSGLLIPVVTTTPYVHLAVAYLLVGLGVGLVNPPITTTAISSMPIDQVGTASAVGATARQTGNALGVAIMGAMLPTGVELPTALGRGVPGPWILAALLGLAIVGAATLSNRSGHTSNAM